MKHIARELHWSNILTRLGACHSSVDFAFKYPSLEKAWEACNEAEWLTWLLWKVRTHRPHLYKGVTFEHRNLLYIYTEDFSGAFAKKYREMFGCSSRASHAAVIRAAYECPAMEDLEFVAKVYKDKGLHPEAFRSHMEEYI